MHDHREWTRCYSGSKYREVQRRPLYRASNAYFDNKVLEYCDILLYVLRIERYVFTEKKKQIVMILQSRLFFTYLNKLQENLIKWICQLNETQKNLENTL